MAFTAAGNIYTRKLLTNFEDILDLNFNNVKHSNFNVADDSDDDIEAEDDVVFEETSITMDKQTIAGIFSMIVLGSYVAIKAPSQSFELFYIMKVKAKGVAEKNISDSAEEHFVLQGETYLTGHWA